MRGIPSRFLMAAAVVLGLVLVALVSASASSSLLPGPVLWALVVLDAIVLSASVFELARRRVRGPERG
ncbi:hypothetical protein [Saccharopolyspora sp. SCSIO 74807]|uniref:hypothetical protein n=1 Tax=Saccharopolyspora sp. SCSIO 74807 TaxID=3118084 RepID=UPI0030D60486